MSFYCQIAYIPTAEMVKNVVDVSFNLTSVLAWLVFLF